MARQVYSIKELQAKISGITNEIAIIQKNIAVVESNTKIELADLSLMPNYDYTKLQFDELYTLLLNVSNELASVVEDPDYFVYPYSWTPGVTGLLTEIEVTTTTLTAKSDIPGGSPITIDIFNGLSPGDFIKISNAEIPANDAYWEVVTAISGVITITGGTLDITGSPDTSMTIELAFAET